MRIRCAHCERPKGHCLCPYLHSFVAPLPITILQHQDEGQFAFRTAHLAQLQLEGLHLFKGEVFPLSLATRPVLIYASEHSQPLSQLQSAPDHLYFLDGTWKKTFKILQLNPWLQQLPQYHLETNTPSRLAPLRSSQKAHALSTLEAIAQVLCTLSGEEKYLQICDVLEHWSRLQNEASAR